MKNNSFITNRSINDGLKIYKSRIDDCHLFYSKYKSKLVKRNCPVCKSNLLKETGRFHNTFTIMSCKRCMTEFVNPSPSIECLNDYYANGASNQLIRDLLSSRAKSKKSDNIFEDRIAVLDKHVRSFNKKKVRILEIGCNSGFFLEKVREEFKDRVVCFGLDLDPEASKTAREKGLDVKCGNIETHIFHSKEKFDIIMHFELIEHLIDPTSFLLSCREHLESENSYMIFTTPNSLGLDQQAICYNFNNRMIAHSIFPPMHLNSFNTINISYLLLSNGFSIDSIATPGRLDVDIINVHSEFDTIPYPFDRLTTISSDMKSIVQDLICRLKSK